MFFVTMVNTDIVSEHMATYICRALLDESFDLLHVRVELSNTK